MRNANMTNEYFNLRMAADEMKTLYRKLALKFHPDVCKELSPEDATRKMQQINAEFAFWYARAGSSEVKDRKVNENPNKREYYETHYTSATYIDSLEAMIKWILDEGIDYINGISVDIVGVFIWIAGIRYEDADIRAKVKAVGFQGSWKYHDNGDREYMWKWTPEIRHFGSNDNIDDIKRKYGSESVKGRRGNGAMIAR